MNSLRTAGLALVALLSSTVVAACGSGTTSGGSGAAGTIRLGLVQGQDFTHALPARVAEAQGIFTKHHLKVQIVGFSAGSDLVKAIAGGSVDVGEATGLDVVAGAAGGVDLKAFWGTASASPMAVIVKNGSPVHALADLKGRSVGISKFGSLTDFTVKLIARETGLAASAVKAVPLGSPSANTAALSKGDVDAIILPVEFAYTLEAAGTPVTAIRVADLTRNSQFAVLAAPGKFLSAHRDEASELTQAYRDAITYLQANQQPTVSLAVSQLAMTQPVATRTYQELAKDFTADGKIDVAGLKAYADQLPVLGLAKKVPAEADYYDQQFVGGGR